MTSITHAQLDWNESGTPVSDQFDDVYFSNVNGLEETRYVFLKQNRLPERWHDFEQPRFVIAETGFGTGLNFLAVWQWFEEFRQQNPNATLQELHFISFEKYPLSQQDLIKLMSLGRSWQPMPNSYKHTILSPCQNVTALCLLMAPSPSISGLVILKTACQVFLRHHKALSIVGS
ncbi:tRNA (5-methylaminomethyl-2-thiouridylate)-methyltransferase [Vibrio maritimus]|uniref:tRNA (5-methylaminomethyl-2-thiouridylate)-methyltransferase n=1 Tax=Vibrio maritimus TaxID=990268 RepID=A0A090TUS3_9VIBR|nr:tRNA (5-methylaminomethyl-2-thiouridylate)-methyltransferase [Vibrio maritimus]